MKASLRLLAAGLLCGCAPTLAGQLRNPEGLAVTGADARVNITSLAGAAGDEALVVISGVDDAGRFATSEALPPGDYLVEALVPGFALTSQRVRLGDGAPVTLTLKPLATAKADVTHVNTDAFEGRGAGGATLAPPSL